MDGKKRSAPPPPRKAVRARRDQPRALVLTDDDDDWLLGDGSPARDGGPRPLTCRPPPIALHVPLAVRPLEPPLADPVAKYTPIAVRRVASDEDWLMERDAPVEGPARALAH